MYISLVQYLLKSQACFYFPMTQNVFPKNCLVAFFPLCMFMYYAQNKGSEEIKINCNIDFEKKCRIVFD